MTIMAARDHIFTGIVLCGMAPMLALSGCSPAVSWPDTRTLPVMHFKRTHIDAGELTARQLMTRSFSFPFSNRGTAALEIKSVVNSCSCAVAGVEGAPAPPGGSGEINVRITRFSTLTSDATVVVTSNDPAEPAVALLVKWRLVAPVEVRPDRMDFGTLLSDDSTESVVEVVAAPGDDEQGKCRIERIECLPADAVTVVPVGAASLPIELSAPRTFRIQIPAGASPGDYSAAVHFHLSGDLAKRATLFVFWHVRDRIEVYPARLSLGIAKAGESRSANVLVSTGNAEPLEVAEAGVDAWDEQGTTEISRMSPDRVRVVLNLQLPEEAGLHSAVLRINCEQPVAKCFEIPVSVFVSEEGGP
jgi:Protein of unknown function (DUF1573)